MDQITMDDEAYQELHAAIQHGDVEVVTRLLQEHSDEQYYSYEETSALFKAFSCEEYDIVSYLIHKGAKIHHYEVYDLYRLEIDLTRLNHLLSVYNKKTEKSCVFQLISWSQSPQGLDGERLSAIMSMYEEFFKSEILRLLMKVLEYEAFDIVFDFSSDDVNRVYRLYKAGCEAFGLTLSNSKEIFIGAQNMLSGDPNKRAKVYGVVAEELCHLALTTLFENCAKAYREEDSKLNKEFWAIVRSVESLAERSCHLESVIKDVFVNYEYDCWECELIARVPHVVGLYGEEFGRRIFKESDGLSRLLEFYDQNVLLKCREYTDLLLNTKSDRIMKQLMGKNGFISFKEKLIRPLMEDYPSFREYVVVEEGVSVLATNCIKLCALHVYHELKPVYGEQLERKCLFFGIESFEKKMDVILKALKCKLCEYLVLLLDDKELQHQRLIYQYLDHFEEFKNERMNIIIISNSQFLGPKFEENFVEYEWSDLADEYKDLRTQPMEYVFKGEREDIFITKENVPKLFNDEDIFTLISGDLFEVQDGADLHCQGYNPETYVDREFQTTIIDRNIFERLPNDTCFLIYCLGSWDVENLSINKSLVQWLKGSDDELQEGKAIFIDSNKRPMNFKDFVEKTTVDNRICLQYNKKVFYLMNSKGDVCKKHERVIRQTEEEIIDLLKSNKTLIISDNAGCGKSTVMSRLIWHVKKNIYNSWVLRVDLNKFSIEDEVLDSDEDVFEDIFDMLGFKNGFEKCHFRNTYNQQNYFIFLDAFDEIQSKYKTRALKLIAFLRKNTDARITITTRIHHQKELEEILNAFSHQLVPFDNSSQVNILEKLWKWKLKFPSREGRRFSQKEKRAISRKVESIIGELEKEKTKLESHDLILALKEIKLEGSVDSIRMKIDDLKFNRLANYILNKSCFDKETLQFMGIPLHLFMIGVIYFDSNFKVEINSGIYSVYSKFIHQKIRIYVEEKQEILRDGREKEEIMKKRGEDAYRLHIELANQVMDEGKLDSDMSKEDLELCTSLGIVFIKGVQVDFLHHTFGEYFRAESIRVNLKKDEFIGVLLDDKYDVVRRFLASSLEEKNFENLKKEFFEDLEFLFSILMHVVYEITDCTYALRNLIQFDTNSSSKIVKSLLEMFENTVNPNFFNEFVLELKSKLSSFNYWHSIGDCLTVKMVKILFNENNDNLKLIFGVVKYYSNPEEVIELLTECISIETSCKCETNERENENRKAESLLKVLKLKDLYGYSLLFYALGNVRMETFAKILEFSKDILGEELFVNEIIESGEYEHAMNQFIYRVDFNTICGFLKTIHSVFGKDMEVLFDKYLKFMMLRRTLLNEDESRNAFEEMINLFKEYFGIHILKEVLLICDSDGMYLIYYLVSENRNLIENLNIIKNILDDSSKMKQFLMFKDMESKNVFYLVAANEDINFGDFLKFCNNCLEKDEIKQMLINVDEDGSNVLHLLFRFNSSERLIERLNVIKNTLDDEEFFKKHLKSKNRSSMNIFHFAAENRNIYFFEILKICSDCLEKDEIKKMLINVDEDGSNVLHLLFRNNSSEIIIETLNDIKNTLDDEELFKQILKGKNRKLSNIFHCAAWNCNEINISFLNSHLCENEIKELLTGRDEDGSTLLHWAANFHSTNFLVLLEYSFEMLKDDKSQFEELILAEDKNGNTFLHWFVGWHFQFRAEFLIKIMESLKEKVSDDVYEKLLCIRNEEGNTFLQIENPTVNKLLNLSEEFLEKDLFQELLEKNENV